MSIGLVYVIGAPGSGVVKIGRSVDIETRFATIQNACPTKVEVRWTTPGAAQLEGQLHAEFGHLRTFGEWFDFGDDDPVAAVQAAIERIQPHVATDEELQRARTRLAEVKLLRVESEALKNIVARDTESVVVEALRSGLGASEIARLVGVTYSYVRRLRSGNKIAPHPSYAHLNPPRKPA